MSRGTTSKHRVGEALQRRWALVIFILASAGLAAAGCGDNRATPVSDAASGGDADASGPACPSDPGPIDPTLLIDDFEHSGANVPLISGRVGSWYASGDATTGAIMQPLGPASPEPIAGGRCGSHKALHITGSGFLDWGSQVEGTMHYGANDAGVSEELPYDAAARGYQGVRFFARVGDTSTTMVRFAVSDQYARPEAGLCDVNGMQGTECYDTFGTTLSEALTTDWREFRIPWTGLAQQNFGLQGGGLPDTSKLYNLQFTFPARVVFDLWVDDISFY
jgi:hypothetical protein